MCASSALYQQCRESWSEKADLLYGDKDPRFGIEASDLPLNVVYPRRIILSTVQSVITGNRCQTNDKSQWLGYSNELSFITYISRLKLLSSALQQKESVDIRHASKLSG